MTISSHAAGEAVRSAPPVAVTVAAIADGVSINHVVGIVTIGYVVLQAVYLVWRWRREARGHRPKQHAQYKQDREP